MPYCPKCRFKYNDGVTKCPDCECDLVNDLEDFPGFENDDIYADEVSGEAAINDLLHSKPSHFVSKSDKYNDLHSSSISLIIVGIAGDIILLLNAFGLFPIHFAFEGVSGILFYVVMGSLLNIFLIGGIVSLKSAQKVKAEISVEENLTQDILNYIKNNFTKASIDAELNCSDEVSIYFEREAFLKNKITSNFDALDDAFLENIIEQLYQDIFEN